MNYILNSRHTVRNKDRRQHGMLRYGFYFKKSEITGKSWEIFGKFRKPGYCLEFSDFENFQKSLQIFGNTSNFLASCRKSLEKLLTIFDNIWTILKTFVNNC